jgi:hypothetical protein
MDLRTIAGRSRAGRPPRRIRAPRRRRGLSTLVIVELSDGPDLDFPDPFARYTQSSADLLERERDLSLQTKPQGKNRTLAGVEPIESPKQVFAFIVGLERGVGGLSLGRGFIRRPRPAILAATTLQAELSRPPGLLYQRFLRVGQP